ncbi:hypothetical protein BJ165DRAFT_1412955 [Panaeolus papilionaceus]|nr:hypothetical protein BJ165DRAFT_1412955 [Panaeolus papilionaceus]
MEPPNRIPLSELTLRRATRDQIIESRKRSFDGFARGTTLEEYLARDDSMDSLPSALNGRVSVWVLAHRDSPTGNFLCACRTFKRDASIIRKPHNVVESAVGYAIASVFTPKANRKKGYASHMMRLLHWVLAPQSALPRQFPPEWGAPPPRCDDFVGDAAFSVLYSDVGYDFYHLSGLLPGSQDGWVVQRPSTTVWDVSKTSTHANSFGTTHTENWKWLSFQDMSRVWDLDADQMKSDLADYAFLDGEESVFCFHPGKGVADYQVQRLEVYWRKVQPPLRHWGVYLAPEDSPTTALDNQSLSTFASWTVEYRPPTVNSLVITRIRATRASFKALMPIILEFADRHGISEVEIWNLESSLTKLATEMGAKTFDREDHLPSFKWYGIEDSTRVTWAFNEKFSWC